jgi:hypothetical protein
MTARGKKASESGESEISSNQLGDHDYDDYSLVVTAFLNRKLPRKAQAQVQAQAPL